MHKCREARGRSSTLQRWRQAMLYNESKDGTNSWAQHGPERYLRKKLFRAAPSFLKCVSGLR